MEQVRYLISDAAKQVEVESHVLRYWEEELKIPIKRNELGHRYYTKEDVNRFKEIKNLKEQGLQLKAIRMILKNGKLERMSINGENTARQNEESYVKEEFHTVQKKEVTEKECKNYGAERNAETENNGKTEDNREMCRNERAESRSEINEDCKENSSGEMRMIEIVNKRELAEEKEASREEKGARLQILLQHMISEAVRENNRELYEDIKECILKEMDYQFRQQEEKSEEREMQRRQREDEHYQKIDEMLRSYSRRGKHKEGEKITFGARKKPSIK